MNEKKNVAGQAKVRMPPEKYVHLEDPKLVSELHRRVRLDGKRSPLKDIIQRVEAKS